MTAISFEALKTIYAPNTGDYPILLLTFAHDDLTENITISSDHTTRIPELTTDKQIIYGTVSNSINYLHCEGEMSWPDDFEGQAPRTTLTVANVGRELTEPIRSLITSPTVGLQFVLASNPDKVEMQFDGLRFDEITINTLTVSGDLSLDMMENEPSPQYTCTPSTTPGIFKL